jgi:hypothetical protein
MLTPSLFGRDIERLARELRAVPEQRHTRRERSPHHGRSKRRVRSAFGARLIVWGKSLTGEFAEVPAGRINGQPC